MAIVKLEPLTAEYATSIVHVEVGDVALSDKENVITKALGVLSENGLYAMAVFLLSCHKREYGTQVLHGLCQLWADERVQVMSMVTGQTEEMLSAVRGLTDNLSKMILSKNLAGQTLTFARYHAKALGNASE